MNEEERKDYLEKIFSDASELVEKIFFEDARKKNSKMLLGKYPGIRQEIWWQIGTILNLEILKELKKIKELLKSGNSGVENHIHLEGGMGKDLTDKDKKSSKKGKDK